jgi:hypothetical protein
MEEWRTKLIAQLRQRSSKHDRPFSYPKLTGLEKQDQSLYFVENNIIKVISLFNATPLEIAKWVTFIYPGYTIEEVAHAISGGDKKYRLKFFHGVIANGDKPFHLYAAQHGKGNKE